MQDDYYSYITTFFKKWAPVYDLGELFIAGIRDKAAIVADAQNGYKILDVCTGTGKQAFAFAKLGYDVTGIDLSEDMLNIANRNNKYENVKFKIADATDIPFENHYFDVSCISFGLHDMPLAIRMKVLEETVRVTRPGGNLIIVDYTLHSNRFKRYLYYHVVKLYESKYYPDFIKNNLEDLLKKYPLKPEENIPVMKQNAKIWKYKKDQEELI